MEMDKKRCMTDVTATSNILGLGDDHDDATKVDDLGIVTAKKH